jgi:hypothetical protein
MEKQTVHLFVFDTLADWKPGFAIAGINNPDLQAQPGVYRVNYAEPKSRCQQMRHRDSKLAKFLNP